MPPHQHIYTLQTLSVEFPICNTDDWNSNVREVQKARCYTGGIILTRHSKACKDLQMLSKYTLMCGYRKKLYQNNKMCQANWSLESAEQMVTFNYLLVFHGSKLVICHSHWWLFGNQSLWGMFSSLFRRDLAAKVLDMHIWTCVKSIL